MKGNTIIKDVAEIISVTPCKDGVANHVIALAGKSYGIAGTSRLFAALMAMGPIPIFILTIAIFQHGNLRTFAGIMYGNIRK